MNSIDEISLYKTVIPNLVINRTILSPIRSERTPSFRVYKSKRDGRYWWYDFGIGKGGDVLSLIAIYNNTDRETIERKIIISNPNMQNVNIDYEYEIGYNIILAIDNSTHLSYFSQYYIDNNLLNKYDVLCVDRLLKRSNKNDNFIEYKTSSENNPIFAYLYNKSQSNCFCIINNIKNDDPFYKIYSPNQERRFESNLRGLWIDGFKQLQYKSDMLIITKSRKDVMCLDMLGFESISFNSESVHIDTDFVSLLKSRYENIFILYDNDNAGINGSNKLSIEHGFNQIFIPYEYETKDTSDTIKKHGPVKTRDIIKQLIINYDKKG